jgi:hypothetical protein
VKLFRFALDEGDLPLAGLLAQRLGPDPAVLARLETELNRAWTAPSAPPSLPALRLLGRIVARLEPSENGG